MDRQTLRVWAHRHNAEGLAGLVNRKSSGAPSLLSNEQRAQLAAWVEQGLDPEKDGVVRWRRVDLKRRIEETFGVSMHERTVGKQLAALGYVRLSVRPRHPKADEAAQEEFKKNSRSGSARLCPRTPAASRSKSGSRCYAGVGQQGTLTRVWAKRGTRRRATNATNGPTFSAPPARRGKPPPRWSCRVPTRKPSPPPCRDQQAGCTRSPRGPRRRRRRLSYRRRPQNA